MIPPAESPFDAAIFIKDLTKRFGQKLVIDRLSLSVPTGCIFGVLGQDGAGKTTLLRMLCGLLLPTAGQIRILDLDGVQHKSKLRRLIGHMGQRPVLYPALTLMQNLQILGDLRGISGQAARSRFIELCDQLGILGSASLPAGTLPQSVQKLAGLCYALVHQPRVLLLDEPGTGLDEQASTTLWSMLSGVASAGTTVLLSSHNPSEMEHCAGVVLLHQGQIALLGAPQELRARHCGGWQFRVEPASDPVQLDALQRALVSQGYLVDVQGGRSLLVFSEDASAASLLRLRSRLQELQATLPHSFQLDLPSMEQVFREAVQSKPR